MSLDTATLRAKRWRDIRERAERSLTNQQREALARTRAERAVAKSRPARYIVKYDDTQPRDESGKWTDGGGSGGSGGGGKPDTGGNESVAGRVSTTPQTYTRRSPSASERGRNVSAVHEPHDPKGVTFEELTRAGASDFHKQVSAAKSASPHGASVELHTPEQYESMRTFQTPDGAGVFALDNGNIVSAAKNPTSTVKGFAKQALTLAVEQGGNKLDAFDTVLPRMYSDAGFRAVARLPFNDEYKPEGWSYETFSKYNDGRPDVVFMVHDPGYGKTYQPGDGKMVGSYEEGIAEQTVALEKLKSKAWDWLRARADSWFKTFDEGEHPRDDHGKFTDGGGSDDGGSERWHSSGAAAANEQSCHRH